MITGLAAKVAASTIGKKILGNKRLIVEYIVIGIVVVMGCVMVNLWWQKETTEKSLLTAQLEREELSSRVTVVEAVNAANEKTINELRKQRKIDAAAIGRLLSDYKAIMQVHEATTQQIEELERTNEAVRDYFNNPVPADVDCMWNPACKD